MSASWCQPCVELEARLTSARMPFTEVDVESPAGGRLAEALEVATVPAVFVKTGNRYDRVRDPNVRTIRAALRRHEVRGCNELSGG
jgi:glutaredoxin